jgi:HlyD family secretion protein
VAAAAVLGAIVIAVLHFIGSGNEPITASGTIEAIQSDLGSKVSGRLASILVSDGQRIHRGEALAELDPIDQRHVLQEAQADLTQAAVRVPQAAAVQDLQSSTVDAQLAQAKAAEAAARAQAQAARASLAAANANLASGEATRRLDESNYARTEQLFRQGFVSAQSLDADRAAAASSAAQVSALVAARTASERQVAAANAGLRQADAAVALAQANSRSIVIDAYTVSESAAARDQATAALASARTQLDETTIRAPFDGTIFSHSAEVGDLLLPGATVFTVIKSDSLYLRVYVMETDLSGISIGRHAQVTVDGLPDKTFDGVVSEIDDQAQFTPSNVQTKDQRAELVFGVKIDLHDPTGALKPGLPADVTFSAAR